MHYYGGGRMGSVSRFTTKERFIASARFWVVALAFGALSLGCIRAQTAQPKEKADTSPAAPSFSIESEMLTYRALQSNSEAIACDIAAYLNGSTATFKEHPAPADPVCDVNPGKTNAIVVVLPFDSSEFADFQIWRADMATMERLQRAAAEAQCPAEGGKSGIASVVPQIAAAETVLAMMATQESTTPVSGTIHDQAFMNGVSRELEDLRVPVLMPTAFTPRSLTPLNVLDSPFLASLDRTLKARDCLESLAAKDENKNNKSIQRAISDIDNFMKTLTESTSSATKSKSQPEDKMAPGGATAQNPSAQQTPAVTPAPPSSSHLNAILLADGLALKLGVKPATGKLSHEDAESMHILLLKALESGGSVTRTSNILLTRIRYSGGAVGTYALFKMDGDLECSGNVYEYGGSLRAKHFREDMKKIPFDQAKQMVFLRHSCRPLTPP
jgi:hypothetical protein